MMDVSELGNKRVMIGFLAQLEVKRLLDTKAYAKKMGKGDYMIDLILRDEIHPSGYTSTKDLKKLKRKLKNDLAVVKKLLKDQK